MAYVVPWVAYSQDPSSSVALGLWLVAFSSKQPGISGSKGVLFASSSFVRIDTLFTGILRILLFIEAVCYIVTNVTYLRSIVHDGWLFWCHVFF